MAMSNEEGAPAPAANIHVEHKCSVAGCGKAGGFGFSNSKSVEVRWWCWEHYPHKEPPRR
jgi:hypothetical protein